MTPGFPHGQHHKRETQSCSRPGRALGTAAVPIHPQVGLQIPPFPPFPPAEEPSDSNKIIYFIPSWGKAQFCPEKVKNLWSWQSSRCRCCGEGNPRSWVSCTSSFGQGRALSFWGVSPSFSNILDDLLQLLFCVHVEFHARLHRGKLDVGGI